MAHMTEAIAPAAPTTVLFPAGALEATGRVQWTRRADDGRVLVVADRTPFHPLDHNWPDQPADRGSAAFAGRERAVVDAVTGAFGPDSAQVLLGGEIPVRRGEPGWTFVAVHVLSADADADAAEQNADAAAADGALPDVGAEIEFRVDRAYRDALSAGHSACHLVSLALNKHVAGLWSKTPRLDCLGHPDFDQSAITESRIMPYASVDRYRLGKSLRKSGFDAVKLADGLPVIQDSVNAQLAEWIASDGSARIDCDGPELTARRWWNCELPEGAARIACGGTHVASSGVLGAVRVEFELAPDQLTVHTHVGEP
jgi:alanyl-tRNA synthetase